MKQATHDKTSRLMFAFWAIVLAFLVHASVAFAATGSGSEIAEALFPIANGGGTDEKISTLVFGCFIGAMGAAALYLFFIWVVMRDRGQVLLILFLVCLGVNIASGNDIVMDSIGPQSEALRHLLQSYSIILAYIFGIFFTYYFLEIEQNAPHLTLPLFAFGGLLLLLLFYSAFDQSLIYYALPLLGVLSISTILIAGTSTMRHGVNGSLTHVVAFLFFLAGALAGPLYDIGVVTSREMANQLTYIAYALAAMMFAIVIAGQFAYRQEEKERELEISNERFALAAKGSNEGLFDWSLKTGHVYFSEQFKKILGLPLENNTTSLKTWWRTIYKPDRRVVRSTWRRFRQNAQATSINVEYRVINLEGKAHWLHTKAVATRDYRKGRLLRFVGSIGDITARKQSESALRASEMRFRSITEAHPVPVLIVNLDHGGILYGSPGAEVLLGLPLGTLISNTIDRFLTKQSERQELIEAMRAGQGVNLKEVALTRGDGNSLAAALSARRINYQNVPAMVIGLYDLTESKEAASKIAKQQEALQQSEKMAALGGLLAGVAHELNNPLSVIVGQSTLLIESAKDEKIVARGEKIYKAADRCSRIVKSFLALARRKPPERKPVDLNAIIHNSLELLGYQFRNENITLDLVLDPALPEVNGDADQLTQVFTNLELNAAQAMQDWKNTRHVTIRTEPHGMGEVLVTVSDTGPGIPPDIQTRVFEPFFTTKGGKGGTGVGLSLCLSIIESHGGHVSLEETPGGGATFSILLPVAMKSQLVEEEQIEQFAPHTGKLRLLIVDDEIELAQTLADLLEPDGHEIEMAENGAIALEKLRQKQFDLIISDLRMPVMDGPTMFAELGHTMPAFQKKIIFVTGDTLSGHIQTFLNQHTVPVIEKPYRLKDVQHAIAALLKDKHNTGNIESSDSPPAES